MSNHRNTDSTLSGYHVLDLAKGRWPSWLSAEEIETLIKEGVI